MRRSLQPLCTAASVVGIWACALSDAAHADVSYAGSESCRECHSDFHRRWVSSLHGPTLTSPAEIKHLLPQVFSQISVGPALLSAGDQWWFQTDSNTPPRYPVNLALRGRNLVYFLARGPENSAQVIPIAYDRHRAEWFDPVTEAHRSWRPDSGSLVGWGASEFAFEESCVSCHVGPTRSVPAPFLKTPAERGVGCETCHGAGREHVELCKGLKQDERPTDWKIQAGKDLEPAQVNSLCGSCHGRQTSLPGGLSFHPEADFFDHFDLAALEDEEFWPDGRARGEVYTMSQWEGSACVQASRMNCLHCHTSSGRYRFGPHEANQACLPCHQERVLSVTAHSHHSAQSVASRCVSCHMPQTEFARMRRHDHSLRPPAPAASLEVGSPNACTDCHSDQDASWAAKWIRKWFDGDYQALVARRASFIAAARRGEWDRKPQMLEALVETPQDPLFQVGLLRLLAGSINDKDALRILPLLQSPSPWVRSAGARALADSTRLEVLMALFGLLEDPTRVVRFEATRSLARVPQSLLPPHWQAILDKADAEFQTALGYSARTDVRVSAEWALYLLRKGDSLRAATEFDHAAARIPTDWTLPVGAAIAWERAGLKLEAERRLRRALELAPEEPVVLSHWDRFMRRNGPEPTTIP